MNKGVYKLAIDHIQFSEDISEKTLNYLSSNFQRPHYGKGAKKIGNKRLYTAFSAVACLLVLVIAIPLIQGSSDFELPHAVGNVSVRYLDKAPTIITSKSQLLSLTEEELFNRYPTTILKGKIEAIKNIKVDFNGSAEYCAIAEIRVEKMYRGNGTVGETVSVLLPCPIDSNVWVEDTGVVSSMRVGMTGIFMPLKYDETSYREENGAKIYWSDFVEYGFLDGERYAFLNSEKGLIYAQHAYESLSSATSLDDIEQYVIKMIE